MKRIFAILIFSVVLGSSFLPVFALEPGWDEDFENEIGEIILPEGTPTVDGVITEGEGWSPLQVIDKTNTDGAWGGEPVEISGELYRAYDENNFYIAAKINIEEFSLCEGEDWIEGNDEGDLPGWDGDVFILSMDPLNGLLEEGFGNEPAAWYCFGLFEGNKVRTYRTHINDKEISDIVSAAGCTTQTGWLFEAAIPWETICEDLDLVSYGYVSLTPEDILKDGNEISAAMIYYDRRYDPEAEQRITHSRYVTIANVLPDGTPGIVATPWKIQAHGIFFVIDKKETAGDDSSGDTSGEVTAGTTQPSVTDVSDTGQKGKSTAAAAVTTDVSSTTRKQETQSSAGGASAQTVDMSIAAAFGIFCTSAIGFVSFRKKKI